jgi:hypothetical protein
MSVARRRARHKGRGPGAGPWDAEREVPSVCARSLLRTRSFEREKSTSTAPGELLQSRAMCPLENPAIFQRQTRRSLHVKRSKTSRNRMCRSISSGVPDEAGRLVRTTSLSWDASVWASRRAAPRRIHDLATLRTVTQA